jgi:RNA polymerase sigma-70 factor (ECF subfamily)
MPGSSHSQFVDGRLHAERAVVEVRPQPPSFAEVFRAHLPFVWRVLRSIGVPPADIEDVCQEVFVVVHRKLPAFEPRASLSTWIYGICWRVWKDQKGRSYRRHEEPMDVLPEGRAIDRTPPPTPGDWANHNEALQILNVILNGLDENKRAMFVLCDLERVPMKDVVAMLGCPLQTGYTRLHAAREHVRAEWLRLRGEEGHG